MSTRTKCPGAAAMRRTRVATCAAKAPTNATKRTQKASVCTDVVAPFRRTSSLSLERLDHGGNDFEQVADDAVLGDLEDRRVGVLVDGDDGLAALHADQMLDGAGDAEREIELRGDGLAAAADLALHRQPAGVADGTRGGEFRMQRLGELLRDGDLVLLLDAAADRDDALGLGEIDRLARFLKRRLGLLADRRRVDAHGQRANGRRRRAFGGLIRTE